MYQSAYTNLNFFLLLTYSCLQNSWSLIIVAIDHSLPERKIIFVPSLLKFSPLLSWIMRCGLAPFPGCQGSCGIVPNGPASLVVSFNIHHGLKC